MSIGRYEGDPQPLGLGRTAGSRDTYYFVSLCQRPAGIHLNRGAQLPARWILSATRHSGRWEGTICHSTRLAMWLSFCSDQRSWAMLVRLSQRVAYCLERARVCGEKARAAPDSSVDRREFSDLEVRWLMLARSYEFSEKLANQIHDRDAYKRYVGSILRRAGADFSDSISTACMTLAFIETMKAVSLTDAEKPDSMMAARLIVEIAGRGERDPDRLCNAVLILMNEERRTRQQNCYAPAQSDRAFPRPQQRTG